MSPVEKGRQRMYNYFLYKTKVLPGLITGLRNRVKIPGQTASEKARVNAQIVMLSQQLVNAQARVKTLSHEL